MGAVLPILLLISPAGTHISVFQRGVDGGSSTAAAALLWCALVGTGAARGVPGEKHPPAVRGAGGRGQPPPWLVLGT